METPSEASDDTFPHPGPYPNSPAMDTTTSSPLSSIPDSTHSLNSSPLSNLSKTPSLESSPQMPIDPTRRYPSPSSTVSGVQSPVKLGEPVTNDERLHKRLMAIAEASADGPPPSKKRRISPPKKRTTEYLDLMKPEEDFTTEDSQQMERLVSALRKKKKIVVIAGAGISVSAGIPDFRSSTGLFATARTQHKLKASGKHLFDASVYKHDETTQSFHTMVREMSQMTKNAKPTPFHHLLASLAQEGRLLRLYSQNIDCIDTSMKPLATNVPLNPKAPWPVTIQLHGGLEKMVCTKCSALEPFNGEVFDGPEAPLCHACVLDDEVRTAHAGKRSHGIGRLRPRFVLYNEYNPDEEAIGNVSNADLKARPDCILVVGTTLKVPGTRRLVKELCQVTRGRRDGLTVYINVDSEPKGVDFKNCWDIVVRSKCDSVARLAALPPWDCSIGDDYLVSQEDAREVQERCSKTTFAVNIPAPSPTKADNESLLPKSKQVKQAQGIPTPTASPKISSAKKPTKSKQAKINFAGKTTATKTGKVTKPRGRKPKATVNLPKQSVAQIFKAGKGRATTTGKARKPLPDSALSLPILRPERRASQDTFFYVRDSSEKSDTSSSAAPSSPSAIARKHIETISPKSVPSGMSHLLDTA